MNKTPNCCRKLFRDCDGILACRSMYSEYERDKCINGKGYCEDRINRYNGKPDVDGV